MTSKWHLPQEAADGHGDGGDHESPHAAVRVGHPAEDVTAEQHPQHVDSIVDRPERGL